MEKFEELSQEKQRRIIDAGMEVFGRNEYKKANTEDIAAKAGISKGLLFYYFKDKKSFYMYLFQYCVEIITRMMDDEDYTKITDFFELMEFGAQKKNADDGGASVYSGLYISCLFFQSRGCQQGCGNGAAFTHRHDL